MKIKEYQNKIASVLKLANIPTFQLEASLFLCEFFNWQRHQLVLFESRPVSLNEQMLIDQWVKRRQKGEPFAYIVGYKHFYKFKFFVDKNVLIPRPETELIVEWALNHLSSKNNLQVLDLGCGSGCLGLSVLSELTNSHLTMVDVSGEAIQVAKKNAIKLNLQSRCTFIKSDVNELNLQKYFEKFDLVLANPPYIDIKEGFVEANVKKYEPSIALFAQEKGLKQIKNWLILSESFLKKESLLLMEFGDDQSENILNFAQTRSTYCKVQVHKDYAHLPRFLSAYKK